MSGSAETGVLINIRMHKSPVAASQRVIQSMQFSFGSDGNPVYKPASSNGNGSGNGNGNGNGDGLIPNMGTGIGTGGEQKKKKRGRPRKYVTEGDITHVPLSSPKSQPQLQLQQQKQSQLPLQQQQQLQPQSQQQQSQLQPLSQQQQSQPQKQSLPQQQSFLQCQPQQQSFLQLQPQEQSFLQPPPQEQSFLQPPQQQQQQPVVMQSQPQARAGGSPPPTMKKARGRPRGTGKKNQLETLGSLGIGFTPHVITVNAGEDVVSRIMTFSQAGPRSVCILSAVGAVSNVTLRQAATSGGSVTYEGRYEILSLSGSFMPSYGSGRSKRSGTLSVSLAGPDGRVLGGAVAGHLIAAIPVQVVVGSFIADSYKDPNICNLTEPLFASAKSHAATGQAGRSSPSSRGTLSESSGGHGSPLNQSAGAVNSTPLGMSNLPCGSAKTGRCLSQQYLFQSSMCNRSDVFISPP